MKPDSTIDTAPSGTSASMSDRELLRIAAFKLRETEMRLRDLAARAEDPGVRASLCAVARVLAAQADGLDSRELAACPSARRAAPLPGAP